MADDAFQKELLDRLDKVIALLSLPCRLSQGCLNGSPAETTRGDLPDTPEPGYLINDEMQDGYLLARQKWEEVNNSKTKKD